MHLPEVDDGFGTSTGAGSLSRRAFLARSAVAVGTIAFADVAAIGAARTPATELDGFVRLSRLVTGVEHLPAGLARRYLKTLDRAALPMAPSRFLRLAGYTAGGGPSTLDGLRESPVFRHPDGRRAVEEIAAAWWSGMVPVEGGRQQVITYQDALVWKALPYAEPPSVCLGATTAWSSAGRRIA
jgi:hypothetical protein